ncbi:MAG: S8 family serine peptidase [Bacteroidia bacterium]|nr:S8 family serine peptidase [Bacteroidia bacterium]
MELNKIKTIILVCVLCSIAGISKAQTPTKYWVKFIDKNGSPYTISSPEAYLSSKSIARRVNQGIAINETDIPVNQTYINQVNATGAVVFQRSKWMNAAIVIVTNSTQLTAINSLTCVLNTTPVAKMNKFNEDQLSDAPVNSKQLKTTQTSAYNYGPSFTQNHQIGADCMHENGYRGDNILIGVLDSGFDNVNNNAVFDSLRNESRIIDTRDIVAGNTSVYEDHNHGAMVLSCISGNTPGQLIGTGPKAKVYLIRTEDVASEKPIEESNWIVGAEYADSVGVDIMTTSLGYTTFDSPFTSHVYGDLNGKTSPMSIAATMAARKGIFVLNANGNDGNNSWRYIGVPADADSICSVGSVNGGGLHSGFSSVGPTADGRIKPDLSSMGEGTYVCGTAGNFFSGNGTSFATPILAGAVACLIQANPTKTNMEILQALKATASKSSNPDNDYGWGIPNVCRAHDLMNGTAIGVNELEKSLGFKLFPNPAHYYTSFTLNQKPKKVQLTDVLGKTTDLIFTESQSGKFMIEFNSSMPAGVYFISIYTSEGFINSKFIKE